MGAAAAGWYVSRTLIPVNPLASQKNSSLLLGEAIIDAETFS